MKVSDGYSPLLSIALKQRVEMISQPVSLNSLQFADSAGCARWVATLPLTNIPAAQQRLASQIALAGQAELTAFELLKILEVLRDPIVHLQQEAAIKYAGKALPLENIEIATWKKTVELWQELTHAYLACRDAYVRGEPGLRPHGALITLRCLQYTGRMMLEHYRIHSQPPVTLWRELHQLYTFAEQSYFAHTSVTDELNRQEPVSNCAAVFCRALLTQLANPFALTARQLNFVDRWLDGWAPLVGLSLQLPSSSAIPPLAVDLASSYGAAPAQELEQAPGLRHLDLEQIARSLRQLITLLKQGQSPAQLGLGEDAHQPGCENLLMLLYIQWCRSGTGRGEQRNTSTEKAQVCLGMHAAHFYISGRAFRMPGGSLSRQEEQDLQLFGRVSERTELMLASTNSVAIESWQLMNHSGAGFMCMLREPDARVRISHNQLIAVRRRTERSFQIGVVQWLRVEENNELFIGVRLLPGNARAVAARPVNFKLPGGVNTFERALLLPESSAPAVPATLILPSGWYQPGRFIDIQDEQKQVAKLDGLLEKGSDFDRCIISLS
jgi:hypothetical protein